MQDVLYGESSKLLIHIYFGASCTTRPMAPEFYYFIIQIINYFIINIYL